MSGVGLPRIPPGRWGHHFPRTPVFISWEKDADGAKVWRVMGEESAMALGTIVLVSRFQQDPVWVRLGEPVAEHVTRRGVRYVASGFLNIRELETTQGVDNPDSGG